MKTKKRTIKKKSIYKRGGLKRKYNTGGSQYDNNTVSAAGQGNPSTTIINVESNPDLLKQRAEAFDQLKNNESQNAANAANQIGTLQQQGRQNIAEASANANAQVESYASGVKTAADTIDKAAPDAFKKMGKGLDKAMQSYNNKRAVGRVLRKTDKALKAAKTLQKTDPLAKMAAAEQTRRFGQQLSSGTLPKLNTTLSAPSTPMTLTGAAPKAPMSNLSLGADKMKLTSTFKPTPLGADKMNLMAGKTTEELTKLSTTGVKGMSTIGGATLGKEVAGKGLNAAMGWGSKGVMSTTGVGAAGVGSGLAKFATSGAGIGTIASLAGAGVTKWSDDGKAHVLNTGEGIGAGLSGAGMGIGAVATAGALMGSAVPVLGTAIGAAAGAIYGVGKAIFARNKAKKAKRKMEQEVKARKTKYNKELGENYAQQKGMLIGAQAKMKEQSGYDTGNVSVARFGGQRLVRAVA